MAFLIMIRFVEFLKIHPQIFEQKLTQWVQKFLGSVVNQVIPIDGKSLRGSMTGIRAKKIYI